MSQQYTPVEASEFYRNKGLKRTTITLSDNAVEFLESKRQEFTAAIKTTKQGEVVEALIAAYVKNPDFALAVDAQLEEILNNKVMNKAGRKEGWRKEKAED